MRGAIAVHGLVIIAIVAISIVFAVIVFWKWLATVETEANEANCKVKRLHFCEEWIGKDEKPDWDSIPPKEGCEEFGVFEPGSKEECKEFT